MPGNKKTRQIIIKTIRGVSMSDVAECCRQKQSVKDGCKCVEGQYL